VDKFLSRIDHRQAGLWCLRLGLAFVFAYAGVSSLQQPLEWVGYLPSFMTQLIDAMLLIKLLAVYELLLAAWLLSARFTRYAALLSAATLAGILVANIGQLIITFRDVGLVLMALALAWLA
jgi:uncharacterized membrane protein YphA (DoxX/SURF4 family)